MAAHEPLEDHSTPKPGSDRAFGVVVGGILLTLSVYLWSPGQDLFLVLGITSLVLVILGLIYPKCLRPLNVLWARLGVLLGRIVSPVILGLIYLSTVVPTGLILRLCGKDLLSLKLDDELTTYWVNREPRGPAPDSLKDQF